MNNRRHLIALATVITCAVGGYLIGYHKDNTIFVESMTLPDMLSSQYPGVITHISPVANDADPIDVFGRTVTKDQYIAWLEKAVLDVQMEEQKRGVQYANNRMGDFIKRLNTTSTDSVTRPMTHDEKHAVIERIRYSVAEIYANGLATAVKPLSSR